MRLREINVVIFSTAPCSLPPQLLNHHVCVTCLALRVLYMSSHFFLQTAPLVGVVLVIIVVVSTGVIIVAVVVGVVSTLLKLRCHSNTHWGVGTPVYE